MPTMDSLQGHLLVATPSLLDPNFRRAVVLVAEHGEDGALGVVLNRPSETEVAEAVPPLSGLVEEGDVVHVGGPVQPSAVVVLAEFDDPSTAPLIVVGDVGFLPSEVDHETLGDTRRARVFAGYAGWAPGQLEAELDESSWIVETALPDDVFAPAAELWSDVLRRKGGQYAILARMPPDPSLN
ncbi:MAG: YqgE/AlgH family protein [Actinobacteria bacterium]|nr:YqgE/AlgH family protein [Actinomycetota bacterium]